MKILCVGDSAILAEYLKAGMEMYLGDAEVIMEEQIEDDSEMILKIETEGAEAVPVPEVIARHKGEDIDMIVGTSRTTFSKECLDMFPNLKVVVSCRGGLENVNKEACEERGILVVNAYGRNAQAVADYTLALALAEIRNVARAYQHLTKDPAQDTWRITWPNFKHSMHISEAKVGIYGFGYIGKLVAQRFKGFGTDVYICDHYASDEAIIQEGFKPISKEDLFATCDIVSLHLRLVPATEGIVSREYIDMMKESAFLINTSRAGIMDYDALYDALNEHRIAGAGLDVFTEEPLPANDRFRKLDNCTVSCHQAGIVASARPFAAKLVASVVAGSLNGEDAPQVITKNILNSNEYKEWAEKIKADIYK